MKTFLEFFTKEDGAVTVDWVVLSAACIGIGMLVMIPIAFSADGASQVIADDIASQSVGYKR